MIIEKLDKEVLDVVNMSEKQYFVLEQLPEFLGRFAVGFIAIMGGNLAIVRALEQTLLTEYMRTYFVIMVLAGLIMAWMIQPLIRGLIRPWTHILIWVNIQIWGTILQALL